MGGTSKPFSGVESEDLSKPSNFRKWLLEVITQENRTISYRILSRELKVHSDAAKRMLYDFYSSKEAQDAKIYAYWIVSGTKDGDLPLPPGSPATQPKERAPTKDVQEEEPIPSSPPLWPSSMAASQVSDDEGFAFPERTQETIPRHTITFCREEQLETVKESYQEIDAIHVHSLAPKRLSDRRPIVDNARQIFHQYHAKNDPLIHNKDYGIMRNSKVRRRKVEPPPMPVYEPKPQPNLEAKKAEKPAVKPIPSKPESKPFPPRSESNSRPGSRDGRKPALKKENSLFQAFAKQSSRPKVGRTDSNASASDAVMSGMDDDEGEEDAMFLDTGTSKKRASDVKKEKDDRAAKLRKMMEDEDETPAVPNVSDVAEMDVDPPAAKVGEDPDAPAGDEVNWSASDSEKKVQPQRRRGRRKVMKKKTMQDEDGFLVTREEEAWESFSEDEPSKPTFKPVLKAAPRPLPAKGGQKAPAKGTGPKKDIMSFFKKK